MKALARFALSKAGMVVLNQPHFQSLLQNQRECDDIAFLRAMPRDHVLELLDLIPESKSQLRQDLFVLSALDFKREGFFVEFGATNGVEMSNTLLLEDRFWWRGILAEPARTWHPELKQNRPHAKIETACVWSKTGETLEFVEAGHGVTSTISTFAAGDFHSRKGGERYKVKTISLNDLLRKHHAPKEMDYLSIDTEGSELEILTALDHDRYSFRVITCEHNHSEHREPIYDLLTGHGYRRVYEDISGVDDWYVR